MSTYHRTLSVHNKSSLFEKIYFIMYNKITYLKPTLNRKLVTNKMPSMMAWVVNLLMLQSKGEECNESWKSH
jgi:hypothetical protein